MSSATLAQSTSAALHVDLIQDASRLAGLSREWFELWSGLPDATPFQSPHWLLPWWAHYGQHPMLAFVFRCNGKLVGLAPLYIYQGGPGQARRVFLMGAGNSDYLDVIFHPKFHSACSQILISQLQARSNLWDECEFQQLRPISPLLRALKEIYPASLEASLEVGRQVPCPTLDLHASDASQNMRKRATYYRQRLEKEGPFSIEPATPQSFDETFDALERLHQHRWCERGFRGVLAEARDRQFQRAAARAFLDAGMLRLYAARLEGKIVAVLSAFCHSKRTYFYLTGFDPDYRRFSIGTIIVGHAIEQARGEGSGVFDFLRGQEAYKYRWGARDQATFRARLAKKHHGAFA